MAAPGTYVDDRNRVMLLIHEPSSSSFDQADDDDENFSLKATIQIRKFAPNGINRDDYYHEHDDGFPDTNFKIVKGYEVIRHHFRGGSVPRSSNLCPLHEVTKTFRLEKVLGKERDLFKLIRIPGNGGEVDDNDDEVEDQTHDDQRSEERR